MEAVGEGGCAVPDAHVPSPSRPHAVKSGSRHRCPCKQHAPVKKTGAQMQQRVVPAAAVTEWQARVEGHTGDVWRILKEEREEKDLRKAEMEAAKMEVRCGTLPLAPLTLSRAKTGAWTLPPLPRPTPNPVPTQDGRCTPRPPPFHPPDPLPVQDGAVVRELLPSTHPRLAPRLPHVACCFATRVYLMCTSCVPPAHCLCTSCVPHVYLMCTACALPVYLMRTRLVCSCGPPVSRPRHSCCVLTARPGKAHLVALSRIKVPLAATLLGRPQLPHYLDGLNCHPTRTSSASKLLGTLSCHTTWTSSAATPLGHPQLPHYLDVLSCHTTRAPSAATLLGRPQLPHYLDDLSCLPIWCAPFPIHKCLGTCCFTKPHPVTHLQNALGVCPDPKPYLHPSLLPQNVLEHEDEIRARPKKTWFQSERQKKVGRVSGWEVWGAWLGAMVRCPWGVGAVVGVRRSWGAR
eukprot:351762-Chlamydomonas_euryale.AAC.2